MYVGKFCWLESAWQYQFWNAQTHSAISHFHIANLPSTFVRQRISDHSTSISSHSFRTHAFSRFTSPRALANPPTQRRCRDQVLEFMHPAPAQWVVKYCHDTHFQSPPFEECSPQSPASKGFHGTGGTLIVEQ